VTKTAALTTALAAAVLVSGCGSAADSRLADIDPVALDGEPFTLERDDTSSAGDRVYRAQALSVDPVDGEVGWRQDVPWPADPQVRLVDGLALVGGGTDVVALDAVSGSPRWQIGDLPGNRLVQTADGVYLTVTVGGIARLVARIEPASGRPIWSFVADGEMGSQVVSDGVRLYLIDGGDVGALDATTGVTVWRSPTDWAVTPPILIGGVIVQRVYPDVVAGLDPESGDIHWSVDLGSTGIESLAAAGGVVVAVTAEAVVALEPAGGAELWRLPLTDQVVTLGDQGVVVHRGATIELVDPATGVASFVLEGSGTPGVAITGPGVLADQVDGSWRLRSFDGAWSIDLGPAHRVAPAVIADQLVIAVDRAIDDIDGEAQGALIALDPTSGTENWRIDTRDGIRSIPVPFGDKLVVLAADRTLG
jgi:outer membrane protein assembly factor BamB